MAKAVLATGEMPEHGNHTFSDWLGHGNANGKYMAEPTLGDFGTAPRGWNNQYGNEMYPAGYVLGSNQPHNILAPYHSVYLFRRIF